MEPYYGRVISTLLNRLPPTVDSFIRKLPAVIIIKNQKKKKFMEMPPIQGNKIWKRLGSYNTHKHRWTAQRPHMGKNAMWQVVSAKQRDNQRGRWATRKRA